MTSKEENMYHPLVRNTAHCVLPLWANHPQCTTEGCGTFIYLVSLRWTPTGVLALQM